MPPKPSNHPAPSRSRIRFYDKARRLTARAITGPSRRMIPSFHLSRVTQWSPWDSYRVAGRYEHINDLQESRRLVLYTIDKGGFGWWIVFVAGIGFFTDAYAIFTINIILPMVHAVYGWPTKSNVNSNGSPSSHAPFDTLGKSATLLGSMVGMIAVGILADRYGRRKLYGLELIITIFGTIGVAMCSTGVENSMNIHSWMAFWRFFLGIGIGADYPLSAVICAEFAPTIHRARMMCLLFLMQAMGQLTGTLVTIAGIAGFKKHMYGISTYPDMPSCGSGDGNAESECKRGIDILWRLVLGVGIIPAFFALFFRLTIPESPRYTLDVDKNFVQAGEDALDYFRYFEEDEEDMAQPMTMMSGGNREEGFGTGEATNTNNHNRRIESPSALRGNANANMESQKDGDIAVSTIPVAGPSSSSIASRSPRFSPSPVPSNTVYSSNSLQSPRNSGIGTSNTLGAGLARHSISFNQSPHGTISRNSQLEYGRSLNTQREEFENPVHGNNNNVPANDDIHIEGGGASNAAVPPSQILPSDVPEAAPMDTENSSNAYPYEASWSDAKRYFITLGKWRYLAGTSLSWLVLDFAFYCLSLNSPTIIRRIWDSKKNDQEISLYNVFLDMSTRSLVVTSAGAVIGGTIMIKTVDHWGTKNTQYWGFIILAVLFLIVGSVYKPILSSSNPSNGVVIILYVLCQIFFNLGPNTTTFILPAEIFPTRYRCTCHGIAAALGKLGSVIAQEFLGRVKFKGLGVEDEGSTSLGHVLQVLAIFMVAGAALTKWLIPETRDMKMTVASESGNTSRSSFRRREKNQKWELKTLEELSDEPEYLPDYQNPAIDWPGIPAVRDSIRPGMGTQHGGMAGHRSETMMSENGSVASEE